jgi:hypothetical protein
MKSKRIWSRLSGASILLRNVYGWFTVGNALERSGKGTACLFPISGSIGGKSFRVVGPQLDLHRS